jgi:hypothetical protein
MVGQLFFMASSAKFELGLGGEFFRKSDLGRLLLISMKLSRSVTGLTSVKAFLALDAIMPGLRENFGFIHMAICTSLPIVKEFPLSLKGSSRILGFLRGSKGTHPKEKARNQKEKKEAKTHALS